jgi:hypothetical protein
MAYFSNSSDGSNFDRRCGDCRAFMRQCPIAFVQISYNYDQITALNQGDETAKLILDALVDDEGKCRMFEIMQKELTMTEDEKAQLELFLNENPKGL